MEQDCRSKRLVRLNFRSCITLDSSENVAGSPDNIAICLGVHLKAKVPKKVGIIS